MIPSAEVIARQMRRRFDKEATVEELLSLPGFRELAYDAARAGKAYTADLVEYGPRPLVIEAVKLMWPEVRRDQRRAEAARRREQRAADRQAIRERPDRQAVKAAYTAGRYRTATQGHSLVILFGEQPSVACETYLSDRYSSRCAFRKMTSLHRITIRPGYAKRVAALGLQTFRGETVIEAKALGFTDQGDEVYELLTLAQSRGTQLVAEPARVVRKTTAIGELIELVPFNPQTHGDPKSWRQLCKEHGFDPQGPVSIFRDMLADKGVRTV